MALTIPDFYKYSSFNTSVEEDWIIQLYYGNETNFLGISGKDRVIDGVQYYGIINEFNPIYSEIDIRRSTASTSDFSVTCANVLKNGTLSEEIYGGTNKYLNRKVKIYSVLNNATSLANCVLLPFLGRLVNAEHNQFTVTLTMEEKMPWDGITIPQDKNAKGVFAPVAYGDFSPNTPGGFCALKSLYPAPFSNCSGTHVLFLTTKSYTGEAANWLHYYDRNLDKFIPVNDVITGTITIDGVNNAMVPMAFEREFAWRAIRENEDHNDFTDPENAWDTSDITYAYKAGTTTATYDLKIDAPIPDLGIATALSMGGNFAVVIYSITGTTSGLSLRDRIYSATTTIVERTAGDGAGTTEDTLYSRDILSGYQSNNDTLPDDLYVDVTIATGDGTISAEGRVRDIYFEATFAIDLTNLNYHSVINTVSNIPAIYVAGDGLAISYTGGSGTADDIHEMHRDLLARFTDFDYADAYIDNWSDLQTARSSWNVRWWLLNQTDLKSVLDQAQYEGCFVFFPVADSDGSGNPGGRYVWVKDSYSSGDLVHTLSNNDYDELDIKMTDIKDLVTSTVYNYTRHPALGNYIDETTYTNSTARTNWLVGATNENVETKNIDMLIDHMTGGSNPNDSQPRYYDNINANPRLIVSTNIVNPYKRNIERGDIIQFNDSKIDPYGLSWANLYFMVISTEREPGNLKIKAREVYSS